MAQLVCLLSGQRRDATVVFSFPVEQFLLKSVLIELVALQWCYPTFTFEPGIKVKKGIQNILIVLMQSSHLD